jgi:hypothetical protein
MSELFDKDTLPVASVTELQRQFPHLPPKVLVTLAVVTLLARTVTPFRLCQCGCGASVHGKARLWSSACRKRVQRERDELRAVNLVIQYEMPVRIPPVPDPKPLPVAHAQGSAPPLTKTALCANVFSV